MTKTKFSELSDEQKSMYSYIEDTISDYKSGEITLNEATSSIFLKTTIQNKKTYYSAKGHVYGLLWGGGECSYSARQLTSDNIDDLREQIMKGISDGSLDSGMGYQRLIGALMDITIYTDIVIDDKVYTNKEYQTEFFGDLSETQQEFLECQMYEF